MRCVAGKRRSGDGEQRLAVRHRDADGEALVAGQGIVHPLGQRRDVGRRAHLGQDVADQLHLAEELDAVQLEKVALDGDPTR